MRTNEGFPVDAESAESIAWLWAHNKPILDELRMVVEPLATDLAAYIEADMGNGDGVARETQAVRTQYGIPFGVPYTLLPPRLFSGLYDGAEAPQLPKDESEVLKLVASYRQRRLEPPAVAMPESTYTTTHEDRMDELLGDVFWMARRGTTIDPIKWEQYRQAAREQAEQGRYDLDLISMVRGRSVKSLYHYSALAQLVHNHATGTFEHFMAMPTAALDIDGQSFGLMPTGYLFMPEGAYGPRFSEKLLRTTVYMVNSAQQVLGDRARQLAQDHAEAVGWHTTRARDGRPLDASLISMAQEGARSTMEAIAFLTADKVPGFDDPDLLLEALITQGIIEEFTRAVPMGMVGPLAFAGKYFPNLVLHEGNGKLVLNPSIMNEIKQAKRALALQQMAEWTLYWSTPREDRKDMLPPVVTYLICPAAVPHGALTCTNKAFFLAYRGFCF